MLPKTDDGAIWVAYREPIGMIRIKFSAGKTHVEHFGKQNALRSDYVIFLGLDARRRTSMGTRHRGMMATSDEQELFGLKTGDISTLETDPAGYLIYKVESRQTCPWTR